MHKTKSVPSVRPKAAKQRKAEGRHFCAFCDFRETQKKASALAPASYLFSDLLI